MVPDRGIRSLATNCLDTISLHASNMFFFGNELAVHAENKNLEQNNNTSGESETTKCSFQHVKIVFSVSNINGYRRRVVLLEIKSF